MTNFKSALGICGLSQQEAADYLQVRIDTVKSWSSGRNQPPEGVWFQLSDLYRRIQKAAESTAENLELEQISSRAFNTVELNLALGTLPMNGAMNAAQAMALLMRIQDHSNSARPDDKGQDRRKNSMMKARDE